MSDRWKWTVTAVAAVLILASLARRWFRTWGATAAEVGSESEDEWVATPNYRATLAITIEAHPEHVWPWLVQMGYGRGGLYSYDRLDRWFGYLDRPSAERILREFQHLAVGDTIPIGRGGGFPVLAVEPFRRLRLGGEANGTRWSWEFRLDPIGLNRTRLLSRSRGRFPATIGAWFTMRVLEPAAFLMTRRMLIGIRCRAETLARTKCLAISGVA